MSHYGPPGGNGPYGQQPEGPWQSEPPYPGQPDQPYFGQPGSGAGFGNGPGGFGNEPGGGFGGPGGPGPGPGGPGPRDPGPGGFAGAPERDPFGDRSTGQLGNPPPDNQFGAPFGGPPFDQGPPRPDGPPSWDGAAPPEKKSRAGLVITLVVVLVVLLGGGGAGWYFVFGPGKSDTSSSDDQAAKDKDGKGAAADGSPAADVAKGDCVVQKGQDSVRPVDCSDTKSFKVVARVDGTTDKTKCPKQETNYIYAYDDHKQNKQDFVLCLATQDSGK